MKPPLIFIFGGVRGTYESKYRGLTNSMEVHPYPYPMLVSLTTQAMMGGP